MAERKPTCGPQATPIDSTLDTILLVISIISGIAGFIGIVIAVVEKTATLTILGITAATSIWIAAAAGAVIVIGVVSVFYYQRCAEREGLRDCAAGVVNELTDSFDSAADRLFPFTAMHPRVDVVVKCNYWYLVENNADTIKCTKHSDPVDQSPILQSFFKSDRVCSAGLGALIGSIVGGVGGILLAALILAGCALSGPLFVFCLIAALLIAAIVTLIGAAIGGNIGEWVADDDTPVVAGDEIVVGHYVTFTGNLVVHGDFNNAVVMWFVGTDPAASLHGTSRELGPPFTHRDPDENLQPDACPVVIL